MSKLPTISPEELRARRVAMGLTQEQFAAEVGVDRQTVNRWEKDKLAMNKLLPFALEALERRFPEKKKK